MTTFDPDTFMNQNIDADISDEYVLCPEGEYEFRIADFTTDAFRTNEFTYKKGPNAGMPGEMTTFNCPLVTTDPRAQAALNRDSVTVFMPIILDFDSNGQLDTGINRNVALGRLRTAVGQKDLKPWGLNKLKGAGPIMGRVKHREIERKDGSKMKVAEVDRVVPIK